MNFIRRKKEKEKVKHEAERFYDRKAMKTWEDAESGGKCFMLYPKSLFVTWAWSHHNYWIWNSFKDTSDDNTEVGKVSHICWLDVRGKFNLSNLSPGTLYEVVYSVKLTKGASGWELPINLRLTLPNGRVQQRQVSLLQKPKGDWIELNVGNFRTEDQINGGEGEVGFDFYEHGGHWKTGLVMRGAIIRPKKT